MIRRWRTAIRRWMLAIAMLVASMAHALAAVDANTATQAELRTVPGIGPAIAERIVKERRRTPYQDIADLQRPCEGPGVVACNPPYDERLAADEALYAAIGAALQQAVPEWRGAILCGNESLAHATRLRARKRYAISKSCSALHPIARSIGGSSIKGCLSTPTYSTPNTAACTAPRATNESPKLTPRCLTSSFSMIGCCVPVRSSTNTSPK